MIKKIMVLDDTADTVEAVKIILESRGFKVLDYTDPHIALAALKKGLKPDLALVDMRMPDISGPEFVDLVRLIDKLKNLKMVFFTASSDADPELLKKHGVLDYVFKPFDMDQLVKNINRYLKE